MSDQPPSLYGDQSQAPRPKAPGLMDQIAGVFTGPVELFQRLGQAPSWGWALGAVMGASLVLTLVWGLKVDVDEMLRPALEKNPQIASSQIDAIVGFYRKFIIPLSLFSTAFFTALFTFLTAFIYWLVGKATAENGPPSYRQALSAVAVASLVRLPSMLLVGLICLVGSIGGHTPEKIAPTSVGYFVQVEGAKVHALLYSLELFFIAEAVLLFLAARHTMRLKTSGAVACVLITLLLGIGLRVLGAK
ncbi:MAG: YIP1 family protein [Geothrix sp.]|nr:YIP1 family protein [Geothrix sp.]